MELKMNLTNAGTKCQFSPELGFGRNGMLIWETAVTISQRCGDYGVTCTT
jgi:hypothetical protein